tara:strand:- start:2191 stop:2424 length:234 start_codon:yes stop_codon:yes gene_type:complete
MIKLDKKYKVTYAIDYIDTNPTIKYFDLWDEMQDWIAEEVANRVQWSVDHSPYSISEKELEELEEMEHSLIKIKELE